jgi:uncharacterized heparinase superfamily protein
MRGSAAALAALARRLAPRGPSWPAIARATPERLLVSPPMVGRGDPGKGAEIYAGRFALARTLVDVEGRSVFAIHPPTRQWAAALHGFGWLADLAAADTALARLHARTLIEDWLGRRRPRIARRPEVAAARVTAWLTHAPFVLEGADAVFQRRFLRCIAAEARHLRAGAHQTPDGPPRLAVAAALSICGLALPGQQRTQRMGFARLAAGLDAQILPDGGHISRNPAALIEILAHLLPVKHTCLARQVAPPDVLLHALERMLPMLRFFRHGDGALALFNGMGTTPTALVEAILALDDTHGSPLRSAPHSGYQRLTGAGGMLAILDAGAPPPTAYSAAAHAGTLAFELSVGNERIVVNCGARPPRGTAWQMAARATAAHSTLGLDDASSCRFVRGHLQGLIGTLVVAGPREVAVAREESAAEACIRTSHDGYSARFGAIHERVLALAADGGSLTGHDAVRAAPGRAQADEEVAVRFHLHPDVRASLVNAGRAVLLAAPSGLQLVFEAGEQPLALEESIHLADPMGPRRTTQIVVRARTGDATSMAWRFIRMAL